MPWAEKREAPAGTGAHSDDQLTGGIVSQSTVAEAAAAAIESAVVAGLLDCRTTKSAATVLAGITAEPQDPLHAWVVRLARVAVDQGAAPTPVVLGDLAIETSDVPPGCTPVSVLHCLADNPPPPVNVPWLVGRYAANVARRRVMDAATRLTAAAWAGDLSELETVVAGEVRGLREAFQTARAVNE